jgi:hypothetical protein
MGNGGTCNVTTRGSIYDTSSQLLESSDCSAVYYLVHSKASTVRERDGRGGSINDLILPSRPSILSYPILSAAS